MDYLPEPVPVADLANILTSIGLEVEAVETTETVKGSLEGLVIGEVLTCEKHPNADKLKITTVNIGNGTPLNIVCGAPNVAVGQRVVVAAVGAVVHPTQGEAFQIKKAKIRGEASEGMICAEDEIGFGKSHAGVMVLPDDAPIGAAAKSYFNIPEADNAIHIGLTPNRSDAMSHIGVARDVCAYLAHHNKRSYRVQLPPAILPAKETELSISVNVEAQLACARYTGISITGVKVSDSPQWIKERLDTIGVRSINNVVDITNYVLHEYGQPLHAFDADKISGKTIKVQFLPHDTSFMSLDDKERKLTSNDLMICDSEKAMCIAGVFGGKESGVTDSTTSIFLESAYFDATHIRRTSLHHGLRTDAATHFEKGVDIDNIVPALMRAASLIAEIAGGKIASEIVDFYPKKLEQAKLLLRYEYVRRLSGKDYSNDAIKGILDALNFVIAEQNEEGVLLVVPTNKTDISVPADIVEEIVRIDGLDNIAIPDRLNISLSPSKQNDRRMREALADLLCGEGFQEIVTNSIVNSKYYPERTDLVRMINSLSSELDIMRPSLLESGLEVVQYNCNRKNNDLALFEFGNIYTQQEGNYTEQAQLAVLITGNSNSGHWRYKSTGSDLFYLKGVLQNLMRRSGLQNATISYEEGSVIWKWKNQVLCSASEVSLERLGDFGVKQAVFFAAVNWSVWVNAARATRIRYTEVAKFPTVQRDLAIVLDKGVSYQQVQQTTERLKLESLKEFGLFDVFEGEKLGPNKKSFALSYTFQLQDRTLTDTEIEQLMQQLITTYKSTLQAEIRE
jgi:phenylalanyl-tRNA synthetase beta chain